MTATSVIEYMEKVLSKMHLPMLLVMPEFDNTHFDFGLRRISGRELDYGLMYEKAQQYFRERVIYKLTDEYYCNYFFLCFNDQGTTKALLIGPFIKRPVDSELVNEIAHELSLPPHRIRALEECYTNIPFLTDDSFLFAMVNTLGEALWGDGRNYEMIDVNLEQLELLQPVFSNSEDQQTEDALVTMQLMEQRYNWENELMLLVSRGQSNRAKKMLPDVSNVSFRQRLADPIRNMKNYCIICNTLMRKAAEQGGVHPIYLDRISSEYAVRIEAQKDAKEISALIGVMIQDYCRLVKKYSMKDYSQHIRHAIMLIDSQLANELTLKQIAASLQLNPSYLSDLFRKETGQTITGFITMRRMEEAMKLLSNTTMQIQDVALYCGVPDANYFSKLFKKHMGCTPNEYRNHPQLRR